MHNSNVLMLAMANKHKPINPSSWGLFGIDYGSGLAGMHGRMLPVWRSKASAPTKLGIGDAT
ncbi:hypothetical protein SLEP1_g58102 [Rubroshorea leprosula]|uniref:Uncharacterized protein n=1 Tax=Rubroshorea leprosula TaxID=152421 RepID=A0AAV5MNH2_9ROSI|nr:hypothetical protein SLEP1_g58102 [Rubroshorea leprosula]